MARRRSQEDPENHERWLVSYADFITLLFAFFVVMYAISSVNEGKYRVLSDTLNLAFNESRRSDEPIQIGEIERSALIAVPDERLQLPTGSGEATDVQSESSDVEAGRTRVETAVQDELAIIGNKMTTALDEFIQKGLVEITRHPHWVEVDMKNKLLFAIGSAQLSRAAIAALTRVAEILSQHENAIVVEGYTDDRPIKTLVYPSNWELSAARAAKVVNYFSAREISSRRMVAIGYGEYWPIANNESETGRQANRRVALKIIDTEFQQKGGILKPVNGFRSGS